MATVPTPNSRIPLAGSPGLHWSADVVPDAPDDQVYSTIDRMAKYVVEDSRRYDVKGVADALRVSPYQDADNLASVWQYVNRSIRFQEDADTAKAYGLTGAGSTVGVDGAPVIEILIRPADMLRTIMAGQAVGDCDDYSMLCAALCRALGYKVAFATVAGVPERPDVYSHVYVVAWTGDGTRVALDCSHGQYPGWEAPNYLGKMTEHPVQSWAEKLFMLGVVGAIGWGLYRMWRTYRRKHMAYGHQ